MEAAFKMQQNEADVYKNKNESEKRRTTLEDEFVC